MTVARFLKLRGPTPGEEAAKALGWSLDRWWSAVGQSSGWFTITGKGWSLGHYATEAIREEQ